MKRTVRIYVNDIYDNMVNALQFVEGMEYADFAADKKTSYAVVRCLEIIGEAARNVPETLRGGTSGNSLERYGGNA